MVIKNILWVNCLKGLYVVFQLISSISYGFQKKSLKIPKR